MTNDEIIEMAVSNGFYKNDEGTITSPFIEDVDISELLLDFAADVAAKEREACAKACEDERNDPDDQFKNYEDTHDDGWIDGCNSCITAIRARCEA